MLIDWFTVVAQTVNFLVLVWLLQRFLYKPVLAAIDAREKKINAQLSAAEQKAEQARTEHEEFKHRNEALEHDRETILSEARAAAATERQRLFEVARQDAQALRAKLADVLAKERQELSQQLVRRTQAEVFATTRRALADLADIDLEARMIEVCIGRLRGLPESQRRASGAGHSAVVRSAFELTTSQRGEVERAIAQTLGPQLSVRFECSPDVICGIEITIEGTKLAWSVADYLTRAAQEVVELEARHG